MKSLKCNTIFCFFICLVLQHFSFAQTKAIELDGFWQISITYECPWGWKEDRSSVLLSKTFGNNYHGMIFGGEIEIQHRFENEYNFEITGQEGCYRKNTLKQSRFGNKTSLFGSWVAQGGNNAMWTTGLCCNGKIEIYREETTAKKNAISDSIKTIAANSNLEKTSIAFIEGKKFILKNVLFELSSDVFLDGATKELDLLSRELKKDSLVIIRLEGHTDIIGGHRSNKRLSKSRVKKVKQYLVNSGINKKRIKLTWYGDKKPILTHGTIDQRKINRRVEVRVLKGSKPA